MTKRQIIKWLESQSEKALAEVETQSEKALNTYYAERNEKSVWTLRQPLFRLSCSRLTV